MTGVSVHLTADGTCRMPGALFFRRHLVRIITSLCHCVTKSCLLKCKRISSMQFNMCQPCRMVWKFKAMVRSLHLGCLLALTWRRSSEVSRHTYCLRFRGFEFQLLRLLLLLIQKNAIRDFDMLGRAHASHKALIRKKTIFLLVIEDVNSSSANGKDGLFSLKIISTAPGLF